MVATGTIVDTATYIKQLQYAPTRSWASHRSQRLGLSYVAVMQYDVARATDLGVLGPCLGMLSKTHTGETRISVVHSDRRVRVASAGAGLFGADFVYLTDETQDGFVYLSPLTRGYLHLVRPQVSGPPQPPLKLAAATGRTGVVNGRPCQEVMFTTTTPLPLRWQLWLCADPDLAAFAQSVARTMTGSPPDVAVAVTQWGAPLESAITLGDPLASPSPSSSFRLLDLTIRPVTDDEFNIPPGYADLRSLRPGGDAR